jgi:ribosomal protein S18 acetylase RimI-like enzyme
MKSHEGGSAPEKVPKFSTVEKLTEGTMRPGDWSALYSLFEISIQNQDSTRREKALNGSCERVVSHNFFGESNTTFVVRDPNAASAIVGTGTLALVDKNHAVTNMAVDPKYRKKGIASRILMKIITEATAEKKVGELYLHSGDAASIALYNKFGFSILTNDYKSQHSGTSKFNLFLSVDHKRELLAFLKKKYC